MRIKKLPDIDQVLSTNEVAVMTGLDDSARGLAVRSQPSGDETELSERETAVVDLMRARIMARNARVDDEIVAIRTMLEGLPAIAKQTKSQALSEAVIARIMEVFEELAPVIRQRVVKAREGKAGLKAYRLKNAVMERDARYPVSKVKHFAVPAVAGVGESGFASLMYTNATTSGAIGALVTAMGVSAGNIGLGIAAGLLARYVPRGGDRSRPVMYCWFAGIAVVGCVVLIVLLNIYAAHYREVAVRADEFREAEVMRHLVENPAALSLTSLLILISGLLCAGLAAWKGWTSTDIPGYERADRTAVESSEALDDLIALVRGRLDAVRATVIESFHHNSSAARGMVDDLKRRLVRLEALIDRTIEMDAVDVVVGEAAVARFRHLNLRVRTDGVIPAYFSRRAGIADLVPEIKHTDIRARIENADTKLQSASDDIDRLLATERKRIDLAKENIAAIMAVIEQADGNRKIATLADVKALIEVVDASVQVAA